MNLPLKKYAEWLSERGQVWPMAARNQAGKSSPVPELRRATSILIRNVTLVHAEKQESLSPATATMLERIAAACGGLSVTIAFGETAAENHVGDGAILAPSLDVLTADPAAKRALWQEIQRRAAARLETTADFHS